MSDEEHKERLIHAKLKERRLSMSHEGSTTHSHSAGFVPVEYQRNLLALLGSSRINHGEVLKEEFERREVLENEGKYCPVEIYLCCETYLTFNEIKRFKRLYFELLLW